MSTNVRLTRSSTVNFDLSKGKEEFETIRSEFKKNPILPSQQEKTLKDVKTLISKLTSINPELSKKVGEAEGDYKKERHVAVKNTITDVIFDALQDHFDYKFSDSKTPKRKRFVPLEVTSEEEAPARKRQSKELTDAKKA